MKILPDNRWFEREQQIKQARALVDLLVVANEAELPPLRWTVNSAAGSSLHGEIDTPLGLLHPQAIFDAWVKFLGLHVSPAGNRGVGTNLTNPDFTVGIYNPATTNHKGHVRRPNSPFRR